MNNEDMSSVLTSEERLELYDRFYKVAGAEAFPSAVQSVSAALHYRSPWSVIEPLLKRMWRSQGATSSS